MRLASSVTEPGVWYLHAHLLIVCLPVAWMMHVGWACATKAVA